MQRYTTHQNASYKEEQKMHKTTFSKILTVSLTAALILSLAACNKSGKLKPGSNEALTLSDTNYADMNNWLSFGGDGSRDVDVFMVYPTVTRSMEDADRPYVQLDSPIMLESASGWLAGNKRLVLESANIYAPLYRQLNGVELDDLNSDTFESYTCATPRDDIFAAFDYYLANVNKGERPFILLGHSQGAQLVAELATTFLGNEKYYENNKNLVIAYAIGVSVTQSQIDKNPNLKFSQSSNDTGVLVSWNTTAPGEIESEAYKNFGTWKSGALVTNPLTWNTDETTAPAVPFTGMMPGPNGYTPIEGSADAAVDKERGVLAVTTVDESQYVSLSIKVSKYHACDIAFFADSISQNVKDRISAFKSK